MDKKLYNKDSIESLSPLEFTRLKPGVYAGDTTYSTQLLVEIVSNAVEKVANNVLEKLKNSYNKILTSKIGQKVKEIATNIISKSSDVLKNIGISATKTIKNVR